MMDGVLLFVSASRVEFGFSSDSLVANVVSPTSQ